MARFGFRTSHLMVVGAVASRRQVEMDKSCSPFFYSYCPHRHIQVVTIGTRTFYASEIWDDIFEKVICLECQCVLSKKDVLETWAGRDTLIPASHQER